MQPKNKYRTTFHEEEKEPRVRSLQVIAKYLQNRGESNKNFYFQIIDSNEHTYSYIKIQRQILRDT